MDHQDDSFDQLRKDNRILQVRLSLAQAWATFQQYAYDVLLHHRINYRDTPEYKDKDKLLDAKLDNAGTLEAGQAKIITYIQRLTNGLTALVRRKHIGRVH